MSLSHRGRLLAGSLAFLLALSGGVFADSEPAAEIPETLEARIDALEAELHRLRAELAELRAEGEATPSAPAARAASGSVFNPDLSINALTTLTFDSRDLSDARFGVDEIEVALSGVVDPFASYFASLVFRDDEVEIEEAYATLPHLISPLSLTLGRRLVPVGLWNPLHKHAWPLNNEPLVVQSFLGAPHLLGTGATFEGTWGADTAFTLLGGVATAVESSQFTEDGLEHPLWYARMQGFREQGTGGLQVGLNVLHGPVNPEATLGATTWGLDAKWRTGSAAQQNRTLLQAEYWRNERDGLLSNFSGQGAYLLAERQVAREWTLGGRIEFADDSFGAERTDRWSLAATWQPSEFQRWRLQLDQIDGRDEQVTLQSLFTLGPHPAHPF